MDFIDATVRALDDDHGIEFQVADLIIGYHYIARDGDGWHEPVEPAHVLIGDVLRTDVTPHAPVVGGPLLEWAQRHLECQADVLVAQHDRVRA